MNVPGKWAYYCLRFRERAQGELAFGMDKHYVIKDSLNNSYEFILLILLKEQHVLRYAFWRRCASLSRRSQHP